MAKDLFATKKEQRCTVCARANGERRKGNL